MSDKLSPAAVDAIHALNDDPDVADEVIAAINDRMSGAGEQAPEDIEDVRNLSEEGQIKYQTEVNKVLSGAKERESNREPITRESLARMPDSEQLERRAEIDRWLAGGAR